jgi:hypothetical protein
MQVIAALRVRQTRAAVISGMLNRFLWLAEAVRRILYDELGTQRVCVVRDTGLEVREPALFLTQPQ